MAYRTDTGVSGAGSDTSKNAESANFVCCCDSLCTETPGEPTENGDFMGCCDDFFDECPGEAESSVSRRLA